LIVFSMMIRADSFEPVAGLQWKESFSLSLGSALAQSCVQ
jgi:hypothetical protein